nr:uncharacterized protein LOC108084934 [Drosophila kikkawai]
MAGMRHEVLLVLGSLVIVMGMGATAKLYGSFNTTEKASTKFTIDRFRLDEDDIKIFEDGLENMNFNEGVVEGDGGCAKIPGEQTTIAGAAQLWASAWVIFLSICLRAKRLLFSFIINCCF